MDQYLEVMLDQDHKIRKTKKRKTQAFQKSKIIKRNSMESLQLRKVMEGKFQKQDLEWEAELPMTRKLDKV